MFIRDDEHGLTCAAVPGSGNGIHIQLHKLKELQKKKLGLLTNKICPHLFCVPLSAFMFRNEHW